MYIFPYKNTLNYGRDLKAQTDANIDWLEGQLRSCGAQLQDAAALETMLGSETEKNKMMNSQLAEVSAVVLTLVLRVNLPE